MTGFEPVTSSLPRKHSTPELHRRYKKITYLKSGLWFLIERKTGVEPATFSLEGWRSTNWATSAIYFDNSKHFVGKRFANLNIIFKYANFIKSGESRIRTCVAEATELQSVPFDRSGISPVIFINWASRGIRTHDPEITNHVLWPTELWRQRY